MHSRASVHRKGKATYCQLMRPTTSLQIPQPCHESWAGMSPTDTGRYCVACAKTVVDFTMKTDAEILAYLAGAASGRTCGRFAAGQLDRPLQHAAPVAPAAQWRAWLAAIVAVWAVREGVGTEARAQAATEWRARYWGGPVPATMPAGAEENPATSAILSLPVKKPLATISLSPISSRTSITMGMVSSQARSPLAATPLVLRGVITDFATKEGLPGVTVLLKGTTIGVNTDVNGSYELQVPAELAGVPAITITVSSVGFMPQERTLASRTASAIQTFQLQADNRMLGEVIIMPPHKLPPAPWHPRRFYYWGKYWLTRPFRRD